MAERVSLSTFEEGSARLEMAVCSRVDDEEGGDGGEGMTGGGGGGRDRVLRVTRTRRTRLHHQPAGNHRIMYLIKMIQLI